MTTRPFPQIRDQLRDWVRAAFEATTYGRSGVSAPYSEAFFLDPARVADVDLMPPLPYRNMLVDPVPDSTEWIHLHADGSVHVGLSDADEAEVLGRNWGEPHPMRDRGVGEIVVYALRT